MKTSIKSKPMRASLLALALATAGASAWGQTPAFTPKLSSEAKLGFYYNNNPPPEFKPVSGMIEDHIVKDFKAKVIDKESSKKEKNRELLEKFLTVSGLRDSKLHWFVCSFNTSAPLPRVFEKGFEQSLESSEVEFAITFAIDHDVDRIVNAMRETNEAESQEDEECGKSKGEIVEVEIAGMRAWKMVSDDIPSGIDFCIVSLDGKLVILGTSKEALEREIALYRGKGPSDVSFGKIADDPGVFCGYYMPRFGDIMRQVEAEAEKPEALAVLDKVIANGREMLFGMKSLSVVVATEGSEAGFVFEMAMKDETDATTLKAIGDAVIMGMRGTAASAKVQDAGQITRYIMENLSLSNEGSVLALRVPIKESILKMAADTVAQKIASYERTPASSSEPCEKLDAPSGE